MNRNIEIEARIAYERLHNGADLYVLPTQSQDVAVLYVALPLGKNSIYQKKDSVFSVIEDMFPFGTKGMKRQEVLEAFELLGAGVSLSIGKEYVYLTLTSRAQTLMDAVVLLGDSFNTANMTKSQFDVSVHRILTRMRHAREDTEFRAHVALMQAMYTKGHPHWVHDYTGALQELRSVTYEEVRDVCRNWSIGTGAIVCLAGDLQVKKSLHMLREVFGALSVGVDENAQVHDCTRIRVDTPMYDVVSMKGKQNVDTVFGIPMAVSVTDSFFPSLRAGVHILGGSSTSRLFNTLRTKKSFTYGAYASLKLFSPSYPGYLGGMAVYPHEVFHTGREALREVVESFVLKGVTQKELREYIEEERGRFSIGLSSTGGIGRALFGTLVEKKPIAYLETYLSTLNELTVRTVNEAIREHVPISQLKIIGAGAVDKDGRPI